MQNNRQQMIEEDEIDLRELFRTIAKNKKMIIVVTLLITVLATVYAYMKTPIYEVKATIKVGEYKADSNSDSNSMVVIASAAELVKELEILYIDTQKNEKNREAWIESISIVKTQSNIFEITSQGLSNELAVAELKKVVDYTKEKHQKILDEVKASRESQVKQAEGKLLLVKTKTLPTLKDKILRYTNDIKIYEDNFINVQKNLKEIKNSNPTLATMQINEQRYLADMLITLKNSLDTYESQKSDIEVLQISKLEEDLTSLNASMKPYNFKNSHVIGTIMTNDYAIKPKKKLIVVVAFVTGLILSIFLVFFISFIRDEKGAPAL